MSGNNYSPKPEVITKRELCDRLGVCPHTLRKWLAYITDDLGMTEEELKSTRVFSPKQSVIIKEHLGLE